MNSLNSLNPLNSMTNVTHNNSVTDMGTRTNTNVQGNNIVVNLISEAQALYSRLVDAVQVINEMDVTAMNSQQSIHNNPFTAINSPKGRRRRRRRRRRQQGSQELVRYFSQILPGIFQRYSHSSVWLFE